MANLSNINNKFLVTTGGNVGIGVTSPVAKLQVAGTTTYNSDTSQALRVCDAADVSKGIHIGFDTTQNAGIIQAGDFGVSYRDLSLNPNAGNVGIGTTGPLTKLDIRGSTFVSGYLAGFDTTPQGNYAYRLTNDGANSFTNLLGGNLGIGIASPGTKLQVNQTNNDIYQLTLHNTHLSTTAKTRIGNWVDLVKISSNYMQSGGTKTQDNTAKASWVQTMGDDLFDISRSPAASTTLSSLMRIDSSGNVGINGASNFGSDNKAIQLINGVYSGAFQIDSIGNVGLAQNAYQDGTWKYYQTNEAAILNLEDGQFKFFNAASGTAGTAITFSERMRITSDGQVNITKGSSGTVLYLDGTNAYDAETGIQLSVGRAKISGFLNTTGGTPGSSLRFYTMPDSGSVTERMRITSAGGVCIGTTSSAPSAQLTIGLSDSVGGRLALSNLRTALFDGDEFGRLSFVSNDETQTGDRARISALCRNTGAATDLVFYTGNTSASVAERMRITYGGEIQVGRGNAGTLYVADNTSSAGAGIVNYFSSLAIQSNNTSCSHFKGTTQGIASYHLYGNGSSSWSSDSRLKRDIKTTRDGYIDDINKLRVVKYKWKNDKNSGLELGLIAQEVEKIFPSLVVDTEDAVGNGETYKSLKYSVLPTILLKGMQEQQKMIQELKAEIELLKSK